MLHNKIQIQSCMRNFNKKQIKFAWQAFRRDRSNIDFMPSAIAGVCLAIQENKYSPDPLICAQINRGQHPGQVFGALNA